ncbi:MAG: ABC transporter permease [Rhodobacteraceae bacterium]|nr:ABC transporter permease [Paracoccaceae bacterium]
MNVARRYAENRVALAALVVLLAIFVGAFGAPLIAPQNPYDLNAIDINDARLPPGSVKLSPPARAGARITLTPTDQGGVALAVDAVPRDDYVGIDALVIRASVAPAAEGLRAYRLEIDGADGGPLDPLRSGQISGLPRGGVLTAGEAPRFGGTWRLRPADFADLSVVVPEGDSPVTLRLDISGGMPEPLMTYWLGSDDQGRDMLSAILYGLRISMIVAISSVVIAMVIGTSAGIYAAYRGGTVGTLIMRLVDLQMSFPTILVALILLAVLGPGVGNVLLALVIVQWALYARIARSVALAEQSKEYVEAARSLGFGTPRILFVHILPNCTPSLIVIGTLEVAGAIAIEATLSFLGLGLPITEPSLGLLVANGFQYLLAGYPWISILPGVAILVAVLAINLVGDELRDILNPRLGQ